MKYLNSRPKFIRFAVLAVLLAAPAIPAASWTAGDATAAGFGMTLPPDLFDGADFGFSKNKWQTLSVWGRKSKLKSSHSSEMDFWFSGRPYQARCYGGRLFDIVHREIGRASWRERV